MTEVFTPLWPVKPFIHLPCQTRCVNWGLCSLVLWQSEGANWNEIDSVVMRSQAGVSWWVKWEGAGVCMTATTVQLGITVLRCCGGCVGDFSCRAAHVSVFWHFRTEINTLENPQPMKEMKLCEHLLWCTTSWIFCVCIWVVLELSSLKSRRHNRFLLDLIAWVHLNLSVKQNRCLVIKISKATSVWVSKFVSDNEIKISLFLRGLIATGKNLNFYL